MTDHWCRWEYRVLSFAEPDGRFTATPSVQLVESELNRLGAEGWEAYAMFGGVVHLKRQFMTMRMRPDTGGGD